uniref:Uncharacterized protein n=1 Tax=viral metagenome TaxID=1070528 RepID=A0A6C0JH99_9ZZZZ
METYLYKIKYKKKTKAKYCIYDIEIEYENIINNDTYSDTSEEYFYEDIDSDEKYICANENYEVFKQMTENELRLMIESSGILLPELITKADLIEMASQMI